MAADIINFNKARKAKAKTAAEQRAVENRIRFGRTKAEKARDAFEVTRLKSAAEGSLLRPDPEK